MGSVNMPLPQGPMAHCGDLEPHDKHASVGEFVPVSSSGRRVQVGQAWCDGVTPLEPFVELTIRVPLQAGGPATASHEAAMRFVERAGLDVFVSYIDHPDSSLLLRVRTADLVDRVYPVIRNKDSKGFKAVVMPDGE